MWSQRPLQRSFGVSLALLLCLAFVAACSQAAPTATSTPPSTTAAVATPAATAAPAATVTAAKADTWAPATKAATTASASGGPATPDTVASGSRLVYLACAQVFVAGPDGAAARQLLTLPAEPVTTALSGSRLLFSAAGQGALVGLVELTTGQIVWQRELAGERRSHGTDVIWSRGDQGLLYSLTYEDPQASTFGRSVELGRLDPATGQATPLFELKDRARVRLHAYDQQRERAYLSPVGGAPAPQPILAYDLQTGKEAGAVGQRAEGPVSFTADLTRLIAGNYVPGQKAEGLLTELGSGQQTRLQHPEGSWPNAYYWSPTGDQAAFNLKLGQAYGDDQGSLGIWSWRPGAEPQRLSADDLLLQAWAPDGRFVLACELIAHPKQPYTGRSFLLAADGSGAKTPLQTPERALVVGWW